MMSFSSNRISNGNRNPIRRSTNKNKKIFYDDDSRSTEATDTDLDFSHSSHHIALDVVHERRRSVIKCIEDPDTETIQKKEKTKEKEVRFSTVNVRSYDLCLGDNPSVARGAPISLDWYYGDERSYELDDYEQQQQHHADKDNEHKLKRPSLERMHLLKQIGYSRREIKEATRRVDKIRKQRFQTRQHLQRMDFIHSFFFRYNTTTSKISLLPSSIHRDSLQLPKKEK